MARILNIRMALAVLALAFIFCSAADFTHAAAAEPLAPEKMYPRPLSLYADESTPGIWDKLVSRAAAEPFNIIATVLFVCAILHTFAASKLMSIAHYYEHKMEHADDLDLASGHSEATLSAKERYRFKATIFHFLGEVEAVFGIWLLPLFVLIVTMKGWPSFTQYVTAVHYEEPVFVVVIMAMASSRPVLEFAEGLLAKLAALGGSTPGAWWLSIMTFGPILGSFITEPAAMTICALLLGSRFYSLEPSERLKYATLGLLFVNISVGGTLTHFAAPPVVMVAAKWHWDTWFMLTHFGWKAVIGILLANGLYYFAFREEMAKLATAATKEPKGIRRPVPPWIIAVHLGFMAWTVVAAHYMPLVVMGFLFFLAFVQATGGVQSDISLRSPMLVGFFLGSLVLHGGGQQWWIEPVLSSLGEWPLMAGATILTAFNDNAAITYLASLVPNFSDALKIAVMTGAVVGGGLTVIANAPNPAGQSILQQRFANGVSPLGLLLGALIPTLIMGAVMMLLP
ncbi:MAG TPA: putative Na+/H+ antiporter [Candidatus Methylacidiphilales bacterium]|nr:putative Na+/H+ antiporter [Candidatus Methylacidiphilales bacterium]